MSTELTNNTSSSQGAFDLFSKAKDLKKRILFTLGALIVYRFGTYLPLPGIDPESLSYIFQQQSGGVLGMFNTFSGGALSRMSIFALNIFPYISASIIMQLMTTISPKMEALKKEGESGRKKINQYTRYGTVLIAMVQAYGISVGLEGMTAEAGQSVVVEASSYFRLTSVVSLVGGTVFLMWLGEQITSRGIGNGISLLIFSGIVSSLPSAIASTLELGRTGDLSVMAIGFIVLLALAVISFVVFFERAYRRLPVQYPKRHASKTPVAESQTTHMPLKLNVSGVIPPIFAGALLSLPLTITTFNQSLGSGASGWMSNISIYLSHGHPVFMTIYGFLIVFFAFLYTAITFNPEETAENLKKNGGYVPGIRPGKNTADYFDYILTRLTVLGSAYLVFICLLPEFLMTKLSIPFTLGGTSLLIVVTVAMDTVTQVQSHLMAQQYESLMKKSKLKVRR
jgi:preprotein translocase subunit SecY